MAEYIDLNEAIIDFGFEWDDIAPTRDEFINFLKSRKREDQISSLCFLNLPPFSLMYFTDGS